jgi:hypothetical protein
LEEYTGIVHTRFFGRLYGLDPRDERPSSWHRAHGGLPRPLLYPEGKKVRVKKYRFLNSDQPFWVVEDVGREPTLDAIICEADPATSGVKKVDLAAEAANERRAIQERARAEKAAVIARKVATRLRIAKALEIQKNTKGAIQYYREVVELAPESQEAGKARERIKALTNK